jgi:hypothetical protein
MHDAVLSTVRSAGPMNLDELMADLQRQHWIGQQHDPPIEVHVPRSKYELISELDRLGREGLIHCGPNGWEPLYVPAKPIAQPQKTLF